MVKAIAYLTGIMGISGVVYFEQPSEHDLTYISWEIKGNTPNALRGFHLHEFGNLTNGCLSTGTHYNPFNLTHGAPNATVKHAGDMGNVVTDNEGVARGHLLDDEIKLCGEYSVIGRSVVIHSGTDDLGLGGNAESLINGNSGPRPACGVIGLV